MALKKELTYREQFVLRAAVALGEDSTSLLFRLAYDGSEADLANLKALPSTASHWFATPKVQAFIEAERAAYQARKMKERERIEQEAIERQKEGQTPKKKFVDYSDPVNQRQKLNELINEASDPDEALDALRLLISQGAKLPPENPNGNQRQIRAYLPLNCRECPLYIEAEKKIKK